MMSFQKNDESDDFSMIEKKSEDQKLNFSVEKLLVQEEEQPSSIQKQQSSKHSCKQQNIQIQKNGEISAINQGSFMQDLHKWQEQLSFQSQPYNVYDESYANENPTKSFIHGKSNSHLKTTKEETNEHTNSTFNDYGYLICDFSKPKKFKTRMDKKLKTSQSSALESDSQRVLQTQKKSKNSLNKFFSPKIQPQRKSSSKVKLLTLHTQKSRSKNSLKNSNSKTSLSGQSEQISKTNGMKSLREMKAYSEYYGFEELASQSNKFKKSSHLLSKHKRTTKQKTNDLTAREVKETGISSIHTNIKIKKTLKIKQKQKQKTLSKQKHKDITLKFKKKKI